MNIEQFAEELRQEVLSRGNDEESGHFREDAFTEVMIEYLAQANEVDEGEICYHKNNARGEKLNAFNMSGDGECADLFVSCYHGTASLESVPQSEISTHFRWLRRFFEAALKGVHTHLEESSPQFDVAQQIYTQREELTKARFYFLTDGVARSVETKPDTLDGIEIQHYLWDLEKLRRFITSRMQRETIEIDFERDFGGAIPCIEAPDTSGEYRTFLTFLPGALLADLYGKYGPRLLEKNVRSFLQARGKINRGIRATILTEPGRFLAYNNGISATAERVELSEATQGTSSLRRALDFQIVNGGQTTASIYSALKKDKVSLADLLVQVKLTVLEDRHKIEAFVPLISQYANSQNKVNAADFSANHPFHVKLEELSRQLWAPAPTGTERQTHWYYERARGSYFDDKGREGTPARMRAFEAVNPLRQKFTKTDLAKYENAWDQFPHFVCLGAEKNFLRFTASLAEKGYPVVDEHYFHRLIAKAILFKTAEKVVGAQGYGGFRAQIVAYTFSWLSHRTAQRVDLDRIWKEQKLSEALTAAIVLVSKHAYTHVVNPPPNRRNPGEWSKREDCWYAFRDKAVDLPTDLEGELIDTSRPVPNGTVRTDHSVGPAPNDPKVEADVRRVMEVPAETWFNISRWAKETNNLLPWQRALAFSLGRLAKTERTPSAKQAIQGVKILDESQRRGFSIGS
jgi:AIPR protein/Abortive infection phage resistance protein N-terminal domain